MLADPLFVLRVQRQAVCKLLLYSLLDYFPVRWLLVKAVEFL